jgi:hypothetical protein
LKTGYKQPVNQLILSLSHQPTQSSLQPSVASFPKISGGWIMKKLVAISVVFALVAGVAFAADVGVEVFGNIELINGSTGKTEAVYGTQQDVDFGLADPVTWQKYTDPFSKNLVWDTKRPGTGFGNGRTRISASAQNDDGTFGGWARFQASSYGGTVSAWGNVWWKPIEQVKFQIGSNGGDGEFGLDGVARWGFYQMAGEVIVKPDNAWGAASWAWTGLDGNFGDAFYGGWNAPGALLTITPMDPLAINLAIPFDGGPAEDVYKKATLQVTYAIDNIGKFGITFEGDTMNGDKLNDMPKTTAYFGLTAIENLGLDIGIGYKFPDSANGVTVSNPLAVGVGVSFNADAFGIKARLLGEFLGSRGGSDATLSSGFLVLFDVLPSYAVSDTMTIYFSAGLGYNGGVQLSTDKTADAALAWHVEPYICITPSYWSNSFFAGIRIESSANKDMSDSTSINWSVPIGITVSF